MKPSEFLKKKIKNYKHDPNFDIEFHSTSDTAKELDKKFIDREEFEKMFELHIRNLERNIKIWQSALKNWKKLRPKDIINNNPKFIIGRILGLKQELEELEKLKQKLKDGK